jgi:hypothetical protein
MRNLRLLTPRLLQPATGRPRGATEMFWLAVVAIFIQVFAGYVTFDAMGLDPANIKLHPVTILVMVCGIWVLVRGAPFHRRCREMPGLVLFIVSIPVLAVYGMISGGVSTAAIYPETYWAAGLLALMLEPASPKQKRLLAKLLIAICVVNAFIALYEYNTSANWFPTIVDPDSTDIIMDPDGDFRANAFFNRSLTGSLITAMAIFLLYTMQMRFIFAAPIFGILLVGLLAYGGRTGLGVMLIFSLFMAVYTLMSGIVRRNLKLDFVLAAVAGVIIIPILITVIGTETSIAERIINTVYFEDSPAVRTAQIKIFEHLTLPDWLFGMSREQLAVLKFQIGLGGKETAAENFWILMLLDLGVIGFAVFSAVFMGFLYHLGRVSRNMNGWLLVLASLIIDTGSNSLGVKTYDLFIEVAFVIAMSGYAGYARSPRMAMPRVWNRLRPAGRPTSAIGEVAATNNRGLQVLASRPS